MYAYACACEYECVTLYVCILYAYVSVDAYVCIKDNSLQPPFMVKLFVSELNVKRSNLHTSTCAYVFSSCEKKKELKINPWLLRVAVERLFMAVFTLIFFFQL